MPSFGRAPLGVPSDEAEVGLPIAAADGAESDELRYVPELHEGDTVSHELFGRGTVVETEGDMAAIYFQKAGVKKLNVAFAPLKKL